MAEQFILYSAETYSKPYQTSKMELFVKIVNDFQSFYFAKGYLDV